MLDPLFPLLSADSAAPRTIPLCLIVEELARELHLRRDSYPRRVTAGKMTAAQAEWRIDVLAAIHADLNVDQGLQAAPIGSAPWRELRAAADTRIQRFTWADIITELRREITMRRRYYPQLIADGKRPAIMLRHQLERIEAAHFIYWLQARHWWPVELEHKRYRGADLTEGERQIYREAYQRHRDQFLPIDEAPRGEYAPEPQEFQEAANG